MNVCVIGSGGREHAICFKLKQSVKLNNLFCMPGNAGTAMICQNLDVDILNFDEIYKTLKKYSIELVVVGPETPLVAGIVDYLKNKGIKVFGPSMKASQLEGSKIFMKNFCKKFNIPTAKYFEVKSLTEAKKILSEFNAPIVVKSDGLAAGKGVTICNSINEALDDIDKIMSGKFQSSNKVIIEEFLKGEEASYFVITDGKNFQQVGTAQDHKRVGENDTGLNTGGMGAYSPSLIINKKIEEKILDKIIQPTINGMKELGHPYTGILYAGLMIHEDEPKLIEYNIRFGDPECQALMMRLKTDLLDLINLTINQKLNEIKINWSENPSITVVAASQGYPGKFKKDIEINNLPKNTESLNEQLFHAGTYEKNGRILSNGGRVLNSTVSLEDLKSSRDRALELLDELDWENKYYRRDIGWRAI
jgi:phosphoribosylamine--glycine ligase